MLTGWWTPDSARRMIPSMRSRHVAERARLGAVAEHRDRPVLQRLAQERRDRAAVVRAHPRPVRVEDAHDRGVDALLAVVGHRQRLGVALGLVVDAARADRVHVAPVGLGLRVHLRVAVDLARRGEQEARAVVLGQRRARGGCRRSRPSACAAAAAGSRSATPARRSGRRSRPARRRRTGSMMSACMCANSGTRMCSMLARDPVSKLSTQITRWPRRSSSSHRCDPRNPAPPVTRQVAMTAAGYRQLAGPGGLERLLADARARRGSGRLDWRIAQALGSSGACRRPGTSCSAARTCSSASSA